jgi:hypothetical protein
MVEQGLLGCLLREPERLGEFHSSGFGKEDFVAGAQIYGFITEYRERYKAMPTTSTVKATFDDWNPPEGAYQYWMDNFTRIVLARRAESYIAAALEAIALSPETAIPKLISELSAVRVTGSTHIIATDEGIRQRLEKFRLRSEAFATNPDLVLGIPTPFSVINRTHQGWMPGELIGIFARPTVGKTWALLEIGVTAWMAGYKVLLVSPEMPANQIALRIDTIQASHMGIRFSHKLAYSGNPALTQSYEALAQRVGESKRWWTVDSWEGRECGLTDIKALTEMFNPDIILIDGISILRPEVTRASEWELMKYNTYGLKTWATYKAIPIIVTHQSVNSRRGQRKDNDANQGRGDDWIMPTLNDAAFGDAFVQGCATVIAMCSDRERSDIRHYSIRKAREREIDYASHPRDAIYWDVDRGKIVDLSDLTGDPERVIKRVNELKAARG